MAGGGCWGGEWPRTNKISSVGVSQKENPHSATNKGNGNFKEEFLNNCQFFP
ncbi:unnamed protein product [Gulo gulo]|uniref:Uncharacterized protein n=1 Tax=Gulo gulo TaxID=48420 RepID=A0A9X9M7W2_GULGU|nr:unnamed protein product [Gulo gulo]